MQYFADYACEEIRERVTVSSTEEIAARNELYALADNRCASKQWCAPIEPTEEDRLAGVVFILLIRGPGASEGEVRLRV